VVDFVAPLRAAEAIIQIASGTEDVEEDDLCRRIGQLYAGMGRYDSTGGQVRMNSASGQVEVIARLKGSPNKLAATVEVEFSVTGSIPVASLKSGKAARDSINARLDRALQKRYGNAVKRHPGSKGAYQVFLTISGVRFNVEGITQVCDVITTTVASIEGS